mgnify:CR=1 FL=1
MSKRKPKWLKEQEQKWRLYRKQLRTEPWTDERKAIYLKLARLHLLDESMRSVRCPEINDLNAIRFEIQYTEKQLHSSFRKLTDYEIKHMISELKKMESEILENQPTIQSAPDDQPSQEPDL